jgi:hypothetical protein
MGTAEGPTTLPSVDVGDGIAMAAAGDVLFTVWKGPSVDALIDRFEPHVWAMADKYPSFVIVQIIMSSSSPPNASVRARARRAMTTLGPRLRCVLSLPVGDGLWTTLVRTIMRGMAVLSGQSDIVRTASSLPDMFERIGALASAHTPDRAELSRVVQELAKLSGVRLEHSAR